MNKKYAEIETGEAVDYDTMPLDKFLDLISREISPSDVAVFADNAKKKIKLVNHKRGCANCPMIEFLIKASSLMSELALWLEVEIETKNKMFGG